jgi:pyruvate dehydrogenase E2 component (dihydrolipoamide acetyltransferase)
MSEPIKIPDMGADATEGTLLNWLKEVGEEIKSGDVIAEIETDKATVEIPVEVSGTIIELKGEPGDPVEVGTVLGYVGAAGEAAPTGSGNGAAASAPEAKTASQGGATATAAAASAPATAATADTGNGSLPGGVKASPVARRIADERGIDLRQVPGSGPGGRIVKEDVETFEPGAATPVSAPAASGITSGATYGAIPEGADVEVSDISKLRSRIATRMVQSKQQVPHFYVTVDMDAAPLLALRKQLNATVTDDTMKVSVNDMLVKAAALTLVDFPNLNAHFYGDKLVQHKRINIGIAVALPGGGLINVVVKDADKVALGAMAKHNKAMIGRAREGKVQPADVQGSTFTTSNLGAFGVDHFQAIVNPPEAGILAIGAAQKVPVVLEDGTLGVGTRMKVTVSVDHRVSDGAEGAEFMQRFVEIIENPMRLVM